MVSWQQSLGFEKGGFVEGAVGVCLICLLECVVMEEKWTRLHHTQIWHMWAELLMNTLTPHSNFIFIWCLGHQNQRVLSCALKISLIMSQRYTIYLLGCCPVSFYIVCVIVYATWLFVDSCNLKESDQNSSKFASSFIFRDRFYSHTTTRKWIHSLSNLNSYFLGFMTMTDNCLLSYHEQWPTETMF